MRSSLKLGLSMAAGGRTARGMTTLIYHRVGGGSSDERDLATEQFAGQLDQLRAHEVRPLGDAVRAVQRGDSRPTVVLTFDDGFADVFTNAWPLLRERDLPFTIYLTTAYVGGTMRWDGSTAKDQNGPALTWGQLREMVDSGLCTVGNHTHTHPRPDGLTDTELDQCTGDIQDHLKVTPEHFAYTWGVHVPRMEGHLRRRFRSAATGELGRNLPGQDPLRLARIPVRGSDPLPFFAAKLTGRLWPERTYAGFVAIAKRAGVNS